MSQSVGYQYKSRISTFSDDASIQEALRVYHYGVDNYTTQQIPDDSIEGNFRILHNDVTTINSTISGLTGTYVEQVSLTATPNILTSQATTTIPITIRAITSQTAPLQQWQNSSSVNVGSIGVGGNINIAGYITVGSTTQSTTTGVSVVIGNPSHKGVVVKAQASQTANIQEWQNSSGTVLSNINSSGSFVGVGAVAYQSTTPATTSEGSFWIDSSVNTAKVYNTTSAWTPLQYSALNIPIINTTASSRTLSLSDNYSMIQITNATANTVTIPLESSQNFPTGSQIVIVQSGSGQVTINATSPATVNGTPGLKLRTQWSSATLIKTGTDAWIAIGDLAA